MAQVEEPVLVQTFVAEAAVERFDLGVLIRLAWLDQAQLYIVLVRPFQVVSIILRTFDSAAVSVRASYATA